MATSWKVGNRVVFKPHREPLGSSVKALVGRPALITGIGTGVWLSGYVHITFAHGGLPLTVEETEIVLA